MPFQNMPVALQPIFQSNMLYRAYLEQIKALCAFRASAYRLPMPTRSGEVMIYSRAGRISPVLEDLSPSSNVPLDNGLAGSAGGVGTTNPPPYPFEQFPVQIGMLPSAPIDLNLIQSQEVIADLFLKNSENLAENAALSMDLRAVRFGFRAYEGGSTFATAAGVNNGTVSTTVAVDNVYGLDTAFSTATFQNNQVFPYGLPQPVSGTQKLAANVFPAAGGAAIPCFVIAVTFDGTSTSSMIANGINTGASGTVTLATAAGGVVAVAKGDTIAAVDGSVVLRPNGKQNRYAMAATDTMGAQMIINAVAQLRRNGVKPPLANGTYPCYIDPIIDAQFFTDPQYQIMSQGQLQSPDFANGRVSRNFGVTFVPTTNTPAYSLSANSAGVPLVTRRAIVCGEKWLQESPFEGTEAALKSMPDMGVADYQFLNDLVFVNRLPLDRAGQILSSMWYWIGGFVVPTNATITSAVVPTATPSRYKSAVVVEVAAAS